MTSEPIDGGLDGLLNRHFAGKVVRKDLTKLIKEGANVPVYVLEYLLGMYCASDDEEIIRDGMETVKAILAENYVRPDEAEKVKSKIKERGSYKVIDKVTVHLNERRDIYEALLSNVGVKDAEISASYVKQFESCWWAESGASSLFTISSRRGRRAHPSPSATSSRSRCRIWIWRDCSRGARPSPRRSGSTCSAAPRGWSRRTFPNGSSGTCWRG
jgi:uncharacterized protein (TIGR02688 family)